MKLIYFFLDLSLEEKMVLKFYVIFQKLNFSTIIVSGFTERAIKLFDMKF